MMKTNTLRFKWSLWTAVTMIITYILLAFVLLTALSQWLLANERNSAQISLSELQNYMGARGPFLTIQDFERNTGLLNQFLSRNQSAKILNQDGIEIVQINPAAPYPSFLGPTEAFRSVEVEGQEILYRAVEFQLGNDSLYIAMSHSLTSYSSMFTYLLWSIILFGILFVIVSGFVGYFLSGILTNPLLQLKEAMQANMPGQEKQAMLSYNQQDEIGELTREYQRLVERTKQVYSMQEQFIGNVSHELRSPIQAMEGNVAMLQRWGKDDQEMVNTTLDILKDEIVKMKRMMETLLDLAKQHEVHQEWVNVEDIIHQAVKDTSETYEPILWDIQIEPVKLWFSNILLYQIITNLLSNAVRYSQDTPSIQIKGKRVKNSYEICVMDEGIGIEEQHVSRIFEPFYTVDETRSKQYGGTGLGLTIVKQLVERSGGQIEVTSVLHSGTKFRLLFPINNK